MGLDESLTQAFETIRKATCFDAFSNIPHVENLRYQTIEEGRAMRQLGMNLTAIVGDQDCEDLQYAAHCIRRYFGRSLPMEPMPEFIADAPRFLLAKDKRTVHRTDPQELAKHLSTLTMPQSEHICIVSSKLKLLKDLLHFSEYEVKFLSMAYVVSSQHLRTNALSCDIAMTLQHIRVQGDEHRNRAIAVAEDSVANDLAVTGSMRILSVHRLVDADLLAAMPRTQRERQKTIWIITEWDRSVTTLLTPFEY